MSFEIDEMVFFFIMKNICMLMFFYFVKNDVLMKESDVQIMYDLIFIEDKKLYWVEGIVCIRGYIYFQESLKIFVDWLDEYMN